MNARVGARPHEQLEGDYHEGPCASIHVQPDSMSRLVLRSAMRPNTIEDDVVSRGILAVGRHSVDNRQFRARRGSCQFQPYKAIVICAGCKSNRAITVLALDASGYNFG